MNLIYAGISYFWFVKGRVVEEGGEGRGRVIEFADRFSVRCTEHSQLLKRIILKLLSLSCVFPSAATTEFSTWPIWTCTASSTGQYEKYSPSCHPNTEIQLFQYSPTR